MTVTYRHHQHQNRSFGWRAALIGAVVLLAACGSKPPTPDWKINSLGAVQRATEAYLSGQQRVSDIEWRNARSEVSGPTNSSASRMPWSASRRAKGWKRAT